jgi:hypothetical protein
MLAVLAWSLFDVLADSWDWSPDSPPSNVPVAHNIENILSAQFQSLCCSLSPLFSFGTRDGCYTYTCFYG